MGGVRGMGLKVAPAIVLAIISVVVAACGGTSTSPTPAATQPTSATQAASTPAAATPTAAGPAAPLTIAINSLTVGHAVLYVAKAEGYFDQVGVPVTFLENTGNNILNLVVSGQADIGEANASNAILATADGKPMVILYTFQGNGAAGFMIGAKSVTTVQQVKRVGAGAPGTGIFGFCNFYKAFLKLSYDCVPVADGPTRRAQLLSGQIDAVLDTYAQNADLTDSGQVNVLIDTRKPEVRKQFLGNENSAPEGTVWAPPQTLQNKKESVTRFMKALGMAMKFLDTATDQQVAQSLRKVPSFQAFAETLLITQEKGNRPVNYPNRGYITQAIWENALQTYAQFGLGSTFDPKDPKFSFAKIVDMSFYDAGIGKP